jgi:drug/metabolite transporter (DMT)-like permease
MLTAAISPLIWLGLIIYGLSVAMWLWVLSKVDLSAAYPFVGVSFLVTMAFGVFLLDESVTPMRIVGTILIAIGCTLVGKSA